MAQKSTAKDVFSYLLMIIVLTISVVSFGALLWQMINYAFPDPLQYYYSGISEIMRNSIASLIVAVPVFIGLSWSIGKDLKKHAAKANLWVRKWLLYLALFVASIAMIIDLISLISFFLDGELTTRFILKVFVVLVMAGGVFGYYLWELRRDVSKKTSVPRISALVGCIAVLIAIVASFFIIGTPAEQRIIRMDQQRVDDLSTIQWDIIVYWQSKDQLPENLDALTNDISGFSAPVDPETGESYSYSVNDDLVFTLCADFSAPSKDSEMGRSRFMGMGVDDFSSWDHSAGEVCFERTIDPDMYGNDTMPKEVF